MSSKKKTMQLDAGALGGITDPNLKQFLLAMKDHIDTLEGKKGVKDKCPTVQDMIDAGITNADQIK